MGTSQKFQFHTGSIKRAKQIIDRLANRRFNSILVRLKVKQISELLPNRKRFNSILVRLKGHIA